MSQWKCLTTRTLQIRSFAWSPAPKPELHYHYGNELSKIKGNEKLVVMMIGWAGANPKHIEKYANFYKDNGFTVVSICPPFYHYKVPDRSIGSKLEKAFRELPENPFVVHSFSMNGIRGVISLWKAVPEQLLKERVKGIIFDSAPSQPYSHQNGKAMMLSRPGGLMSDNAKEKMFGLVQVIRDTMLEPLLKLVPSCRPYFSLFWYMIKKVQLPTKQMYLYSTADSMVPVEDLEKFIEIQRSRSAEVKAINFEDSEHVAHFRACPDKYKRACLQFVEDLQTPQSKL